MVARFESGGWKGEEIVDAISKRGAMPDFGAQLLAKSFCSKARIDLVTQDYFESRKMMCLLFKSWFLGSISQVFLHIGRIGPAKIRLNQGKGLNNLTMLCLESSTPNSPSFNSTTTDPTQRPRTPSQENEEMPRTVWIFRIDLDSGTILARLELTHGCNAYGPF